ncbi:MAG: hypothetical protein HZA89_10380 [Verrucomicrobia bacterium]|nr:hypothetical protein [Verrucomicrobiota bacterium]
MISLHANRRFNRRFIESFNHEIPGSVIETRAAVRMMRAFRVNLSEFAA